MNRDEATTLARKPHFTDLYFIGGVPVTASESDLSSFFSRFVSIDTLSLRRAKNPTSSSFAFLRTSVACDLLQLAGNSILEMNGHVLNIEPAEDPKEKLLMQQNEAQRKVFIGNLPIAFTVEDTLKAIQTVAPVQRLSPFKVKSNRTKYCYAIMQHLEDAITIAKLKRLMVPDPSDPNREIECFLGAFISKDRRPTHLLESKNTKGKACTASAPRQSLPFNESLGSKSGGIPSTTTFLDDSYNKNLASSSHKPAYHSDARPRGLTAKAYSIHPDNMFISGSESLMAGYLDFESQQTNLCFRISLRKGLTMAAHYRHEQSNIRFNIMLQ